MSRRSGSSDSDNLELLLDTMCNAFGGVIFIAILLAVLSQFAEVTSAPKDDPVKQKELEREHATLESELRQLRADRDRQGRVLQMMGGVADLANKLGKLKEDNVALKRKLKALEQANEESSVLGGKEEGVKDEIKVAMRGEMRKLDLPKLRASRKITVFFIIKWSRLFVLRIPTSAAAHGPVNRSEVRCRESQDATGVKRLEYEAIPGRGIQLDGPGWENSPGVRKILNNVSPQKHSLHFAVYSDSYAALKTARRLFLAKGYEYNWHIMPREDMKLRIRILKPGAAGAPPPVQR